MVDRVVDLQARRGRPKKKRTDPDRDLVKHGLPEQGEPRMTKEARIAARSQAATALRVHGAPYSEIANTLGFASAAEARREVEAVLASTVDETKDYLALRALEGLRLEGLYRAVAERALDGKDPDQLGFHRAAVSVLDRIIKLHGLDAPQRLELINPGAEEFERVLGQMRKMVTSEEGAEPDIFTLEPLDADWEEGDDGGTETGLAGTGRIETGADAADGPLDGIPDEPEDR